MKDTTMSEQENKILMQFKEILIVNNKSTLMISIPDKIKNADYVNKLVK